MLCASCFVERRAAGGWLLALVESAHGDVGTCVRTSADVPEARPYAQGAFPFDLSTFPPFHPFCSKLTAQSSKLAPGGWRLVALSPLTSHLSPLASHPSRCAGFAAADNCRRNAGLPEGG